MKLRTSCLAIIAAIVCVSGYAQYWPIPDYNNPAIEKPCTGCGDLPTPGLGDPVQRFVGRFVSSAFTGDWQAPFRTVRAGFMETNPAGSRFYLKFGNAVAVYDATTFLARLSAHETMTDVQSLGVGSRYGNPLEQFLQFDRYFYAENYASLWMCPPADGQDRLFFFDVDDRGYVYMAYSMFGWGFAVDPGSGGGLMSSYQNTSSLNYSPTGVYWVHDGNNPDNYYVFAGRGDGQMHLFRVPTLPAQPVEQPMYGKGISKLARGGTRTAIVDTTGQLNIYDTHSLVNGGAPLFVIPALGNGTWADVAFDGTSFWAASAGAIGGNLTGTLSSITINPGQSGYTKNDFMITSSTGGYASPMVLKWNGGYLGMVSSDSNGRGLHLYRTTSGTPVEISLETLRNYYSPPAGYARPAHTTVSDVFPWVAGGNLYVIVSANGLGDVFQIKSADAITVNVQGAVGGVNSAAPARTAGDLFYGDTVQFTATLGSGTSGSAINWNFGAPRDPASTAPGTIGATISHQYSGLTAADIASPLSVSASNPASGVVGSTAITLKTPTARLGVRGVGGQVKYLFAQPNASSAPPIVTDDSFVDGSDGDVTSHVTEWRTAANIASLASATPQYLSPSSSFAVGACGVHTLSMTDHYGYSTMQSTNVDFPVTLAPSGGTSSFSYQVVSYAAAVDVAFNAGTGNIEFSSQSRAANTLSTTPVNYTWTVVDQSGAPFIAAGVKSGTATISTIPLFAVAKTLLTSSGLRGHLVLTMSDGGVCGTPLASSAASSAPLIAPDAQLGGSCANGVCTFSVTSPSGVLQSDAWTFAWSAPGGTPSASSTASLTTSYTTVGTYTIGVDVTNKMGLTTHLSTTQTITTPASSCPVMTDSGNTFISYAGTSSTSTCRDSGGACVANEPITFSITYWGYSDTCGPHTYAWTFDGIAGGSTKDGVNYQFASAGSHTVSCTINNGHQLTLSKTITISSVVVPPPPPPPPPTGCSLMNVSNTYLGYTGQSSGCMSPAACSAGEQITFHVDYWGYSPSCATHTYTWSVDGQQVAGGQQLVQSFTTSGTHNVACSISNGSQTFPVSLSVTISGGSQQPPPPTGTCPLMTVSNTYLGYSGSLGCTTGGNCGAGEGVTFHVDYWGYSPGCATHTYTWTIDGQQVVGGQQATQTFSTAGPHNVSCSINNGSQTFVVSAAVTIVSSTPATPAPTVIVTTSQVTGMQFRFTPTVSSGTVTKFIWDFGDGYGQTTPDAVPVDHTYTKSGTYTVTMTAQSSGPSALWSATVKPVESARPRAVRH